MPRTQTIGEQLVRSDALHDYFRQGPATALMVSIVSTMVSLRLWAIAPHDEVGLWVGSLIGLQIVRLLLSLGFRRRERSPEETRNWGIAATVLSVCLGLVLSLGAIWFSRDSSVPDQIFILFVLGGFSAGSLTINAFQYDIVCNGIELSSGAIRNHRPEIMYKAFEIAGYANSVVEEKFGGMLNAFKFGAPPHGGSAPGIDRIVMLLAEEKNIREVIAFPLNQRAEDLLMQAPTEVPVARLKELSIRLDLPLTKK